MLLSELSPYVAPDVLGCPGPLVTRALRDSAIEFCRMSRACWLRGTHALAPSGDSAALVYTLPTDQRFYAPVQILINGTPAAAVPDPAVISTDGRMVSFSIQDSSITYTGLRSTDTQMDATWAIIPKGTAVSIPDSCERWRESIVAGAKWKLMTMTQTQWFSADAASFNEQMFRSGINQARIAASKNFSDVSLRVRPARF